MTEEKEVPVMEEKEVTEKNGAENNDATEDETELESELIRQVEYYFGDINLPRDKFLREQVQLDDGWVPLEVLTRFHRLAKLTMDTEVIAKTLAKSTSGLLEISDDNKKVRRNPELPIPEMNEERRKELANRTVYAKGFPKDSSLDELLKFFKQFEDVENIIMRKYQDKTKKRCFKGSVFAMFKTREQAEKFISQKELKYKETDLLALWQEDYIRQKQEEYASKKQHQKEKKDKKDEAQAEKEEFKLPSGAVLHFAQGTDKMKREDVKDALTPLGADVAFIDFKVGDTEGWVRLTKENAAKELAEKLKESDGKLKIADADVVFKLIEGEEETAYLNKTIEEMSKRRKNNRNNKFNKGKNFKGKQGRKRRQDDHGDAPPRKVAADS